MIWSNVATPATPSMSTEMKTLMACGPSCRDGRHLGCEPAAEVHAVDRPGTVAGEVAAHSLRRAVRDDVLVAGTGEQRDRHRWLLLGLLLALLAQDGEHLRLDLDLHLQPAASCGDVADRGDRLEPPGVLRQRLVPELELLGLDIGDAEVVLERPLLQQVVELRPVGPAVRH